MKNTFVLLAALFLCATTVACSDDTGDDTGDTISADDTTLDIAGVYVDNFGNVHRLSDSQWITEWTPWGDVFAIEGINNASSFLVAQNDADNTFNPNLFSRFEWSQDGDDLHYCQSVFDAESADAALNATPADSSNLETGCGGFAWSTLTAGQGALAIIGGYTDNFDSNHVINETTWTLGSGNSESVFEIASYENATGRIVAQNAADNQFDPSLWSRFDWAWSGSTLVYCRVTFNSASREEAAATAAPDAEDLDGEGCGGFAWSIMTAVSG